MPDYKYIGDEEREFPTLSLLLQPGEEFTSEDAINVDGIKAVKSAAATSKKPTTDAPASDNTGATDASA